MQLQTTLTRVDGALALWRLVGLVRARRELPQTLRREARDLGLAVTIVLRRPADAAAQQPVAAEDVEALIRWLVEGLETAGVSRREIAGAFNRCVYARPAPPPMDLPAGHVLVRSDVLDTLAAGQPLSAAAKTEVGDA